MEKGFSSSSKYKSARLSYIEKIANMNEKTLLTQLNSIYHCYQYTLLDQIQENNSTIHSSNKRIYQSNHYHLPNTNASFDNLFDKTIDYYIMQYNTFSLSDTESMDDDLHRNKHKENVPLKNNKGYGSKSKKIKDFRGNIIEEFLLKSKELNKRKKYQRGYSCFNCFGTKKTINSLKPKPNNDTKNNKDHIDYDVDKGKDIKIYGKNQHNEEQMMINHNYIATNHNQNNEQEEKNSNATIINNNKPSTINNTNHKLSKQNTDINLPNEIFKLDSNNQSLFETFTINYPEIHFALTSDIAKAILYISKITNLEYILHSFTFIFDKNAFINDLYFYEIKLRSNFEKILQSKNIKYPLFLYGNVYIPHLVIFRGNEEVNFHLLETPITTPMIIAQLMPENYLEEHAKINLINHQILEEAITLTNELHYDIILIDLLRIDDNNQLAEIIKSYIEAIAHNWSYTLNSVFFLINTSEPLLEAFMNFNDVGKVLEKAKLKSTIISI